MLEDTMIRRLGSGAALAAATLLLAACSGSAATPAATAPAPAGTGPAVATPVSATTAPVPATGAVAGCEVVAAGTGTAVEIKGFAFPSGLSVKAGEAIAWANGDGAPHTVTFNDGSCASGTIGAGATVVVRYLAPGTYAFHCAIHANMTGTLEVVKG
jgi:plastocyanin